MASVTGAQNIVGALNIHAQIAAAADTPSSGTSDPLASNYQYTPITSSLADTYDTLPGSSGSHDTVASSTNTPGSGPDTVTGPHQGTTSFAGEKPSTHEKVVATQTVHPAGVTVHFADGSSLTVAGVSHIHAGFFH